MWWAGGCHPAEPINGIMVSNFFQKATKPIHEPWPMAPGTVHPENLAGIFENSGCIGELSAAHLLPLCSGCCKS